MQKLDNKLSVSLNNQLLDIINYYAQRLNSLGINNAKNEIIWYLEFKKLTNRHNIYLNNDLGIYKKIKNSIRYFFQLRKQHKPFQYIIKSSSFYNRDFYINKNVLIPRPESETFIEILKNKIYNNVLEIGTGSGVLSISLSLEMIGKNFIATDISSQALYVAKKNIKYYNIKNIQLKKHNILKDNIKRKFDLIISNPPYISKQDYNVLPKHIKCYEPEIALTDNSNGLIFYKNFAQIAKNNLNSNGIMILEIGKINSMKKIQKIFINNNFNTEFVKDQNDDYRLIIIN